MIQVSNRTEFLQQLKQELPYQCRAVEIGVLYGDFAADILNIVRPSYLGLIDPYEVGTQYYGSGLATAYSTEQDYHYVLARFAYEIISGRVVIHKAMSYDVVDSYPNASLDMVYIDGSHIYDAVRQDLNDWAGKVKNGGYLCGHDYINEPQFGVVQALDEFIAANGLEFHILNTIGGDFAIKISR